MFTGRTSRSDERTEWEGASALPPEEAALAHTHLFRRDADVWRGRLQDERALLQNSYSPRHLRIPDRTRRRHRLLAHFSFHQGQAGRQVERDHLAGIGLHVEKDGERLSECGAGWDE